MNQGRIIKLIGGLYTVTNNEFKTFELKPIGLFRHQNINPKVGDYVLFDEEAIKKVLPRKNDLIRPYICNVDQAIIIQSSIHPDFSLQLLDKFLVILNYYQISPIICITKVDLLPDNIRQDIEKLMSYYQKSYQVIYTSTKTKEGIQEIKSIFKDKVSVLTGQSGAGKSSLLNELDSNLNLATDEISKALGRGKHTTRHVELLRLLDGWIADTPGFSRLDLSFLELEELAQAYPDFFERSSNCKYHGCMHDKEPDCAVKEAVMNHEIPEERYSNYLKFRNEIKSTKKKF